MDVVLKLIQFLLLNQAVAAFLYVALLLDALLLPLVLAWMLLDLSSCFLALLASVVRVRECSLLSLP